MLKANLDQVPLHLAEIGESFEQKFTPVLSFNGWRIAMLRHSEATDFNFFHQVERHNQTNEVFILTNGNADLVLCENGEIPGKYFVIKMKLNVAYNILRSVWHHVVMSDDAHIIIFEKSDTSRENSNYYELDKELVRSICNEFSLSLIKKEIRKEK
jgi:hypothetical protein